MSAYQGVDPRDPDREAEEWAGTEMENRRDREEQDDPHADKPFSRFATW